MTSVLLYTTQFLLLTTVIKKAFENFAGKEENACNPVFSPFPTMFSRQKLHLQQH